MYCISLLPITSSSGDSSSSLPRVYTFLFENIPLCLINTLRRIILNDLVHSGFNQNNIKIIKNTTTWNNEILAHRISLIPILHTIDSNSSDNNHNNNNEIASSHLSSHSLSNSSSAHLSSHLSPQLSSNSSAAHLPLLSQLPHQCQFEINEINTNDSIKYITSNNFTLVNGSAKLFDDILICQLKKHEEIQIIATSDINCAKNGGIAYRPVSNVYFKPIKLIYIVENKLNQLQTEPKNDQNKSKSVQDELLKYFKECAFNLHSIELINNHDKINTHTIKKTNYNCIGFSDNIVDFDPNELCTVLNISANSYIIETYSAVYAFIIELFFKENEPKTILKSALFKFNDNLKIFLQTNYKYTVLYSDISSNSTNNTNNSDIFSNSTNDDTSTNRIILHIMNMNETILNPISYFLRQNDTVLFAHYNKSHPDQKQIDLHITLNKNYNEEMMIIEIANIVKSTIKELQRTINHLIDLIDNKQ